MSLPNQKVVQINKAPCDEMNVYAKMNVEAIDKAAKDLSKGSAFKLWVYFAKNTNGFEFELSAVAVQTFCGVTEKTYREAVKELVAKRYLVPRGEKSNHFDFYEIPQELEVPRNGSIITCHTSTTHVEK